MRILVVYTHPHPKSLANALLQRVRYLEEVERRFSRIR